MFQVSWTGKIGGTEAVRVPPDTQVHATSRDPDVGGSFFLFGCPRSEREVATMQAFATKVRHFLTSEDGPTAVEYAVMLALIVVVCITVVGTLGKTVNNTFSSANSAVGS
jgi:pilus assembly protein Flp/PilA